MSEDNPNLYSLSLIIISAAFYRDSIHSYKLFVCLAHLFHNRMYKFEREKPFKEIRQSHTVIPILSFLDELPRFQKME